MTNVAEVLRLGLKRQQAGRFQEAEAIYKEILADDQANADALHLLGVLSSETGRHDLAAGCIGRAITLNPAPPFYHNNLGNVLHEQGRFSDALLCYEEALRRDPLYAEAHNNLANSLHQLGRFQEALPHYLEAVRLKPDHAEAYNSFAAALRDQGLLSEALGCYEEALRLAPENADAHAGRAILWLLLGDFERGWPEYEWRWKAKGFPRRVFQQPLWDGALQPGPRILLHAEQGLGDTIQFLRYVPLVKQTGATVLVECQPRLVPLVETVEEIDQVIAAGLPLPAFDAHLPFLSLPGVFHTTLETVPNRVPYLRVPQAKLESWRRRVGAGGFKKVGIAWAGSPTYKKDRDRSLSLSEFAPLSGIPGIRLFSLQKVTGEREFLSGAAGLEIEDLEAGADEITDTAAAIQSLDLVIAADTMVAHLAGALGAPVWTLLPYAADWRWLVGREDSPWYPTMRLFRQPSPGNWQPVMEGVVEALRNAHRS